MNLTDNFTLKEMTRSAVALRMGLPNAPPEHIIPNLRRVARVLEKVRAGFGRRVFVSSGYRAPAVNFAVGGSERSAHRHGLAADFEVEGVPVAEVCCWVRDNLPEVDQVIYEFGAEGWCHISVLRAEDAGAPRRQALTALRRGGMTVYLNGIQEVA